PQAAAERRDRAGHRAGYRRPHRGGPPRPRFSRVPRLDRRPHLGALQLDRADWHRERVVVRGKGDIERAAVITGHARDEVERYLAARADDAPPLFLSYSRARRGQRLTVRGAEDVCTR